MPKIAVVHDYFTQFGGAERVAIALAQDLGAPLFTSVYQPQNTYAELQDLSVTTTYLQGVLDRLPVHNFKLLAPFYARAFQSLDLSTFDAVIVSSSGYAHHIRHPNAYIYCHTPPHFIHELDRYTNKPLIRAGTAPFLKWMQRADLSAAAQHAHYVANSEGISARIREVYGKTAPVIHPMLATDHLPTVVSPFPETQRALIVGRLLPYKRFDLAIAACAELSLPLTIVGTGPDEARLRQLAGPLVTFRGRISDAELQGVFAEHSVVLSPGIEDFGFGPIEANYAGRPVIAAAAGGALETVTPNVTGALVRDAETLDATSDAWTRALRNVLAATWDPQSLRATTQRFSRERFATEIRAWIGINVPEQLSFETIGSLHGG